MRQLTRSMIRLSWTLPLLGMQQVTDWVRPDRGPGRLDRTGRTLDALSEAAYDQMSPRWREVYERGEQLQRRSWNLMTGGLGEVLRRGTGRRGCQDSEETCCGEDR